MKSDSGPHLRIPRVHAVSHLQLLMEGKFQNHLIVHPYTQESITKGLLGRRNKARMNCAGPSRPLFSAVRRFCSGCTRTHIPIRPYSTKLPKVERPPVVLPSKSPSSKLEGVLIDVGELKTILPTMDELGLSQGDHGKFIIPITSIIEISVLMVQSQ